jgi:RsiW-degrading membrane proteinase PrsW (M82 family)
MVIVHTFKADTFSKGMLAGAIIWVGFALTHSLKYPLGREAPSRAGHQ